MGILSDVVCFPCKILGSFVDCFTAIFCCPCRCMCGCPKTSTEGK